jgi:hypothetical protein
MNGLLCSCCALVALVAACDDDKEDTMKCSKPKDLQIEIAPLGASEPVRTDLTVSGTIALDADMVVYAIALAVYSDAAAPVYDIPAAFTPPTTWSAQVPLSKLLAPTHGAGTIEIGVRASTNCDDATNAATDAATDAGTNMQSMSFQVAPPLDAGVDAP